MPLTVKTTTSIIPDNGLAPRRSIRFAAGSLADTMTAAIRLSAGRQGPVWVYATYYGLRVELSQPAIPTGQSMERIEAIHDPAKHEYTITKTHIYNSWAD